MNGNTVFKNEYVKIFTINRDVFAETYKKGFQLEQLHPLLENQPQVVITSLNTLRSLLLTAPAGPRKIGNSEIRYIWIFPLMH